MFLEKINIYFQLRFLILKTGRKVDMGIDMTGEIDSG
jgi:hypothetical protein